LEPAESSQGKGASAGYLLFVDGPPAGAATIARVSENHEPRVRAKSSHRLEFPGCARNSTAESGVGEGIDPAVQMEKPHC